MALAAVAPGPLGAAASLVAPGVASADPIADCTATTGVLVAVDFTSFNDVIREACVADSLVNPITGVEALQEAGFSPVPVTNDGGFFTCQLTDPFTGTAEPQTSCANTPPGSAYWSYWHGLPGQSGWTYSSAGAGVYYPCLGSIEFWSFGSGSKPTPTPAEVRGVAAITPVASPQCPSPSSPPASPPPPGTTASPKTTPPATAAPSGPAPNSTAASGQAQSGSATPNQATGSAAGPTGAGQSGAGVVGSPVSAAGTSSQAAPATTTRAGTSTSTGRGTVPPARASTTTTVAPGSHGAPTRATSTSSTATGPAKSQHPAANISTDRRRIRIADVPTSTTHHRGSGSPVGLLAGIGALALLGGGAGIFAWRRNRRAQF